MALMPDCFSIMLYLRSKPPSFRRRVRGVKTDQICFEKRTGWKRSVSRNNWQALQRRRFFVSKWERRRQWSSGSASLLLGVRYLGTAKRFYVDGLGWKPVYEDKKIIFFQAGGMVFALFLRDKLAADFQTDPARFGQAAMALATMCAPRTK